MKKQSDSTSKGCTIRIEHQVMGSLTTQPGDCLLSYTDGVSSTAEGACQLAAGTESTDYASWWMIADPMERMTRYIHVQAQYTKFGGVRAYNTRAVYECRHEDIVLVGGNAPILGSLDRMRLYDKPEYSALAERMVIDDSPVANLPDLPVLSHLLLDCLNANHQVFIRLGDDEKFYADELRKSPRLLTLLRAIDQLPGQWPTMVSVAFGVESTSPFMQSLGTIFNVVAHYDDSNLWSHSANACLIDWTKSSFEVDPSYVPESAVEPKERTTRAHGEDVAVNAVVTVSATEDTTAASGRKCRTWVKWLVILLVLACLAIVITALIIY